jgi:hypothetical protein
LFFCSNEGDEAPHVHVQRDDLLAKFWVRPVALAANSGFSARDLRRVVRIIVERQTKFMGQAGRLLFDTGARQLMRRRSLACVGAAQQRSHGDGDALPEPERGLS